MMNFEDTKIEDAKSQQLIYLDPATLNLLRAQIEPSMEECCGFLLGYENRSTRVITTVISVPNTSPFNRERTFQISAKDYLRAEGFADSHNLNLLGIYHTHPNSPAIPSEFDRVAAQPYFSYVIISVINRQVNAIRSWRLNDNHTFEEESLITINHSKHVYGHRNHSNTAA